MPNGPQHGAITVYLEGHEGHQGNVLVNAFISKLNRLILVLNKMERVFINSPTRRTDFEITAADKRNPTTLTLRPVPRAAGYNPHVAFDWSLSQLRAVAIGERLDERIRSDIAGDLVRLATKDTEDGYTAFWINGSTASVRFDDDFLAKAEAIMRERKRSETSQRWHVGAARGAVVGQLKAVDDIDDEREFVIVPPTGAEAITCTFPNSMREEMGQYLFQTVRVEGILHYGPDSPFPYRVDTDTKGISKYPHHDRKRTLSELRGVFAGQARAEIDWADIVNV